MIEWTIVATSTDATLGFMRRPVRSAEVAGFVLLDTFKPRADAEALTRGVRSLKERVAGPAAVLVFVLHLQRGARAFTFPDTPSLMTPIGRRN